MKPNALKINTVLLSLMISATSVAQVDSSVTKNVTAFDRQEVARSSIAGGVNGGGGGVYKLDNGKLITLPEFGILFKDDVKPVTTGKVYPRRLPQYEVPDEVYQAHKVIVSRIKRIVPNASIPGDFAPFRDKVFNKENVDPAIYKRIKEEYSQVLVAIGYQLEDDKFILPAYSENGLTYILPDFKYLNAHQKAKILIHESQMRNSVAGDDLGRIKTLEFALKLDTLIQELAFPKTNESLDILDILQRMAKLDLVNKAGIFQQIMLMLAAETQAAGHELSALELMEDFNMGSTALSGSNRIELNPVVIQELQERYHLKWNYAELLEGTVVDFPLIATTGSNDADNLFAKSCNSPTRSSKIVVIADPREAPPVWTIIVECNKNLGKLMPMAVGIRLEKAGPFVSKLAEGN